MNEQVIAEQQAQNIPQPTEHVPAAISVPELTGFGNAAIELDEMTQYKLHDVFGAKYDPNDQETRQRLQFIYKTVSDMVDSTDYPIVASKARELMRIAGVAHSEQKLYKLYEWLRLSNVMRNTGREMELLRDE